MDHIWHLGMCITIDFLLSAEIDSGHRISDKPVDIISRYIFEIAYSIRHWPLESSEPLRRQTSCLAIEKSKIYLYRYLWEDKGCFRLQNLRLTFWNGSTLRWVSEALVALTTQSKISLRPPNVYGHWFGKAHISGVLRSSVDVIIYPQKFFQRMQLYICEYDVIVGYILFSNLIFMLTLLWLSF